MPWSVTSVADEKLSFIADWRCAETSFAELCRRYGISRQSGYELVGRYEAEGVDGLKPRSRAPHTHPNAVSPEVEAALLGLRAKHPRWGAKKLLGHFDTGEADEKWPAVSTVNALLGRHGLLVRQRVHRRVPTTGLPLESCQKSNEVWGIDFKGWFRTLDGARCDPLSLSDLFSRYVLRLQVVARTDGRHVWPVLEAAFYEFGLPRVIRSDNGPPFAGTGAGGLSAFSVKLVKAGVLPERIQPGKPQQNGRHERLHRTVKEETADPPATSCRTQQRRFDAFRTCFNNERPHEALGMRTPASVYQPVRRVWSGRLREPEYGNDHLVRRVRQNGEIKWRGELIFLGTALAREPVGITETDGDRWRVCYGLVQLGMIDAKGNFARPSQGRAPAADERTNSKG